MVIHFIQQRTVPVKEKCQISDAYSDQIKKHKQKLTEKNFITVSVICNVYVIACLIIRNILNLFC